MKTYKKLNAFILFFAIIMTFLPNAFVYANTSEFVITSNGRLTAYNGRGGDVIIPDGVTIIETKAFRNNTAVISVVIPNGVTRIDPYAFQNCTNLKSINIPDSITEIYNFAFGGCTSLTTITIPANITTFGQSIFSDCTGLTNVTIKNGLKEIGSSTFIGCTGLTSITIPDSVERIGFSAFENCTNLTNVAMGSGVKIIASGAFKNCTGLKSITIPNGVTEIGRRAFERAGLTSVTIPDSVVTIEQDAFLRCSNLMSVTMGSGLENIANTVFMDCPLDLKTDMIIPDNAKSFWEPYLSATSAAQLSEIIANIEKKYEVKIIMSKRMKSEFDHYLINAVREIDYYFKLMPSELHTALMKQVESNKGTLTIEIDLLPGTLSIYSTTGYIRLTDMSHFTHEYAHFLHHELSKKIGSGYNRTKDEWKVYDDVPVSDTFAREWISLNAGNAYSGKISIGLSIENWRSRAESKIRKDIYITPYSEKDFVEDVAEVFNFFTMGSGISSVYPNDYNQKHSRVLYGELKDTAIMKKMKLLEKYVKEAFGVEIFLPYYSPQTPNPTTAEAIEKAFENGYAKEVTALTGDKLREKITVMNYSGIFGEKKDDPLNYELPVNRGEFCGWLMQMLSKANLKKTGQPLISGSSLLDMKTGEYVDVINPGSPNPLKSFSDSLVYYYYSEVAVWYGLISGVSEIHFNPRGQLSRETVAVILHRAANLLGIAAKGGSVNALADSDDISEWAKDSVNWAIRNGVMNGTGGGNFSPKQLYTYEEAIVTLVRFYDMVN
jgi:hypothetical protein